MCRTSKFSQQENMERKEQLVNYYGREDMDGEEEVELPPFCLPVHEYSPFIYCAIGAAENPSRTGRLQE